MVYGLWLWFYPPLYPFPPTRQPSHPLHPLHSHNIFKNETFRERRPFVAEASCEGGRPGAFFSFLVSKVSKPAVSRASKPARLPKSPRRSESLAVPPIRKFSWADTADLEVCATTEAPVRRSAVAPLGATYFVETEPPKNHSQAPLEGGMFQPHHLFDIVASIQIETCRSYGASAFL